MRSPNSVSVLDSDGLEIQVTLTDWWLPADQVILDSVNPENNEPRAGDIVVSAAGEEFEGMRPGSGASASASVSMGQYHILHTKQIKAAA